MVVLFGGTGANQVGDKPSHQTERALPGRHMMVLRVGDHPIKIEQDGPRRLQLRNPPYALRQTGIITIEGRRRQIVDNRGSLPYGYFLPPTTIE